VLTNIPLLNVTIVTAGVLAGVIQALFRRFQHPVSAAIAL
jgi:hypothetical protein